MKNAKGITAFISECTSFEDEMIACAIDTCKRRKGQLTAARKMVLLIVSRSKNGIKAYDILAVIRSMFPKTAPTAVYRSLSFLISMGLITCINTSKTYKISFTCEKNTTEIILVCPKCKKQSRIVDKKLIDIIKSFTQKQQLVANPKTIEIVSVCYKCITY